MSLLDPIVVTYYCFMVHRALVPYYKRPILQVLVSELNDSLWEGSALDQTYIPWQGTQR